MCKCSGNVTNRAFTKICRDGIIIHHMMHLSTVVDKLIDFVFVNLDGKQVVCRRKDGNEGSVYPLDGTAGTCSAR